MCLGTTGRVGVEQDVGEAGHVVEQPVAGFFEDIVSGGDVEGGVEADFGVGVQLMPDPANAHAVDVDDPGGVAELVLQLVDETGVDPVHQAAVDVTGGVA